MNPLIFEEWMDPALTSSVFCLVDLEKRRSFYRYSEVQMKPFIVREESTLNDTYLVALRPLHSRWLRMSLALVKDIIRQRRTTNL